MSPRSNPSWGPMRKIADRPLGVSPQRMRYFKPGVSPPNPYLCHCDDPIVPTTDAEFDAWDGRCGRCGKQADADGVWLDLHPEERSPKRRGN